MSIIKSILTAPKRIYHKRRTPRQSVPQGPTLIAAEYDPSNAVVVLSFDQAVDLSSFDPAQVFVKDGAVTHQKLQGFAYSPIASDVVQISLEQIDTDSGTEALLDTIASAGIVAADDDVPWTGATDYVLMIV